MVGPVVMLIRLVCFQRFRLIMPMDLKRIGTTVQRKLLYPIEGVNSLIATVIYLIKL